MLEWLTFAAAALAAVGAIVGPAIAYRSAMATIRRQENQAVLDRRQTQVELAVQYAISEDPAVVEMGLKQLTYLLDRGELSAEQRVAVASAIEASLTRATEKLEGTDGAPVLRPPPDPPALGA